MSNTEAYFQVVDASESKRPFIIRLERPELVAHARKILSGEKVEEVHVQGTIVKAKADYNPDWPFHVDPGSITFFSNAIEVCDATMAFVEENLDEIGGSTLPGNHWCPWTSQLVREVPAN